RQRPARRDPPVAARRKRRTRRIQRLVGRRADPRRRGTVPLRAVFLNPEPRRRPGPLHLPRALREIRGAHRLPSAAAGRAAAQRVLRPRSPCRPSTLGSPLAPHLMTTASHFSLLVVDDEPDLRTL